MRVIFMGSPEFAVPALRALVAAGHTIACVYCQPPRPAGRGKRDRPTPVQVAAEALNLPVRYPETLRTDEEQADFAGLEADVAVVAAYGLILPQAILDAPRLGCVNIHASLLPRWRGAAPIHRAVMAGDSETGICIMQMEAGLDTGPVLKRGATPIGPTETTGDLHDRLAGIGADLIVETLREIDAIVPTPQPDDGVTYAKKIDKAEAAVDWTQDAQAVARQINGLSPFPGAWAAHDGNRVKLLAAEPITAASGPPGHVLDGAFTVACGAGAVRILRAQRAGRGAQTTAEFLRGYPLVAGDAFA